MRIGIITGSIQPKGLDGDNRIATVHGEPSSPVFSLDIKDVEYRLIARHSLPPRIPPHKINHRANVQALKDSGAEAVISICSTGALHREIPVPSMAVPEDYIDLSPIQTFFDHSIHHTTPGLDGSLSDALASSIDISGIPFHKGGVYIQTRGPRLETRAEVRMLATFGDYVGMNLASEAGLCSELNLPAAGLITVDNHANGISDTPLDYRDILSDARTRWEMVLGILKRLPEQL